MSTDTNTYLILCPSSTKGICTWQYLDSKCYTFNVYIYMYIYHHVSCFFHRNFMEFHAIPEITIWVGAYFLSPPHHPFFFLPFLLRGPTNYWSHPPCIHFYYLRRSPPIQIFMEEPLCIHIDYQINLIFHKCINQILSRD